MASSLGKNEMKTPKSNYKYNKVKEADEVDEEPQDILDDIPESSMDFRPKLSGK